MDFWRRVFGAGPTPWHPCCVPIDDAPLASSDKDTVRARLRERRQALIPSAAAQRSEALIARLVERPQWRDASNIAAFVGVAGEPGTDAVLRAALQDGKTLWLPRVLDAKAGLTQLVQVVDLSTLVDGPLGLREPPPDAAPAVGRVTPSMALDLILVPGLGFDRTGCRLGHGPGHYDRLLAEVRELDTPYRVGLCFSEFLDPLGDDLLPTEDHDVPMHAVLTDTQWLQCVPLPPHVIEPASSARAKCRGCGLKIEKGALRFGERIDNPYGDGLATLWFHLACAALRRPQPMDAVLTAYPELQFENRTALAVHIAHGLAHHRLPRLTRAMLDPSGRARCRHCHERIDKGTWRLSLSIWQDGRFEPMGFVHAACAHTYFECQDPGEFRARIARGSDLDDGALDLAVAALTTAPT